MEFESFGVAGDISTDAKRKKNCFAEILAYLSDSD